MSNRISWQSVCVVGALWIAGLGSVPATGQTVVRIGQSSQLIQFNLDDISMRGGPFDALLGAPTTGKEEDKGDDEKPKTSDRLTALKKLVFDRRPSAILSAWSTVQDPKPEVPPDPEEEKKKADEAQKAADKQDKATAEQAEAAEGQAAEEATEEATADGPEADSTDAEPADDSGETPESDTAETEKEEEAEAAEPELSEEEKAAVDAAEKAAKKLAKEEKKKAKEAADKAKKELKEAKKKYEEAKKKLLEWELENFKRMVSLGNWEDVRAYLAEIEDFEAEGAYEKLLTSLVKGPIKVSGPLAAYAEKNFFTPEDLTGLAACLPGEVKNAQLDNLAKLLRLAIDEGCLIELCLDQFRTALEGEAFPLSSAQVARIVLEANLPIEAGSFLPTPEEAIEQNQREVLNLLTRHYLAVYAKEQKTEHLEHAWDTTQAALADGEIEDEDKEEALKRAVAIAPDVREELGQAWLEESFTERPERGMEILQVIGSGTSTGLFKAAKDGPKRLESLKLQTTAAEAVLAAAPDLAKEWGDTLTLLANNWLQEAVHSYKYDESTSRGPSVSRDPFGNVFYSSYRYNYNNRNVPTALSSDELLLIRPSDSWLNLVTDGLRPKFAMVTAQLLLKVNEESDAFPYIERLAQVHPTEALELVHEFLRVWTRNNNPNSARSRTSQFMFIYGYDARGEGIPLTRSKQERNLKALAGWVKRLRQLPLEDIDEQLIAKAFTSAHSRAEVYQLDTIEKVFGDMDGLKPETLANLVQKMRENLAAVWRDPATQKDSKTKRRQRDIETEILRGYEVAGQVAAQAIRSHPDDWALHLAKAAVAHDENNYRQEISQSPEFSARRHEALAAFALAAELYAEAAPDLKLDEETIDPYQTWFYASLGACDLRMLDHEKQPAKEQFPLIREAIESLEGEVADRALASFATGLFTRMSNVNPAVKFGYVRAGLEIVGDHPRAREAQEVAQYYGDLVTEIKLETRIDGSDQVGDGQPFGMFINIRHTGAIEREAGGFSKYLVNQNSNPFGFNFGRPPEDYRDKFDEAVRESLSEHFEVLSVTFNHPDTNSRATKEYGWRITPYAYILMKARGPEIDRVPPLRLDLDFSDTTGYAVLPAESAPLAINASASKTIERPYRDLTVTQTLDERQAKDGKLLLEVKASALGLVPGLDSFLNLAPKGFDIVQTDDMGVSVAKFDEEAEETAVLSERIWMVSMQAKEKLEALPETFEFGSDSSGGADMEYQRFVDADLEMVTANISLEQRYGETDSGKYIIWGLVALLSIAGLVALFVFLRNKPVGERTRERFAMPDVVSPFTVIGLLRDIHQNNGVSANTRAELVGHIEHIERYYFDQAAEESPDLEAIARRWVGQMR